MKGNILDSVFSSNLAICAFLRSTTNNLHIGWLVFQMMSTIAINQFTTKNDEVTYGEQDGNFIFQEFHVFLIMKGHILDLVSKVLEEARTKYCSCCLDAIPIS